MSPSRAWPLRTVTLDGRGIAVARSLSEVDAIYAAQGYISFHLKGERDGKMHPVTAEHRLRIGVREPTREEADHFLKRAPELRRGLVAVALP